jgi:hypothetical protein
MTNGAAGTGAGGGAAVAAAAIANAIKAAGAIVKLKPREFVEILNRTENALVVFAQGGFWSKKNRYLTSYRGFIFYTKTETVLQIPAGAEVIVAKKIWAPE